MAKKLGDVTEACRRRRLDRSSFYEWKRRFQTQGFEGAEGLAADPHEPPADTTPPETVERIKELALEHLAYGCNRLEAMLALEGRAAGDRGPRARLQGSQLALHRHQPGRRGGQNNSYCARGDKENRIKEQQRDLFADRTSCHRWWPNQFRLLLPSLAYALLETIRRLGLTDTEMARAQAGTIRLNLLKIGAVILRNIRRVRFHLSTPTWTRPCSC